MFKNWGKFVKGFSGNENKKRVKGRKNSADEQLKTKIWSMCLNV